jgi:hypothetical protein
MRETGLVPELFRIELEAGIVLGTEIESKIGFEINSVVGFRILTESGPGRSSERSEEVSSLDGNYSWLAKTD